MKEIKALLAAALITSGFGDISSCWPRKQRPNRDDPCSRPSPPTYDVSVAQAHLKAAARGKSKTRAQRKGK